MPPSVVDVLQSVREYDGWCPVDFVIRRSGYRPGTVQQALAYLVKVGKLRKAPLPQTCHSPGCVWRAV